MVKAVFAGSFDPPTNGHLDIIKRASKLFSTVDVVVSFNPDKHYMFSQEERLSMLEKLTKDYKNVSVHIYEGLIVNYAKQVDARVLVRGVRSSNDFGYEFELAMTNKQLLPGVETLFMPTDPNYFLLRSSAIKEMAAFGADISKMVPKNVAYELSKKIVNRNNFQ